MHTLTTLFAFTLTLGATLTTAARPGASLHGHTVQSIPHHVTRDLAANAVGSVATFAFYDSSTCNSQPEFLQAQNATCYGPLVKETSFQLVGLGDGCQALARIHPCGSDDSALSILETNGKCWQTFTAEREIDVWVQCGLPSVIPSRVASPTQQPPVGEQAPTQTQPVIESQPVANAQPIVHTQAVGADEQPPANNQPAEQNGPDHGTQPVEENVPAGVEQGGSRGGSGGGQRQPQRGRQGRRA